MYDFSMVAATDNVEAMLAKLEITLSGPALSTFLSASMTPWLKQRAQERFANEGDEVVGRWAPLQPATQEFRANGDWPGIGPDHPINRRTGELEELMTSGQDDVFFTTDTAVVQYPRPSMYGAGELALKVETAQRGKATPRTVARPVAGFGARDLSFLIAEITFLLQTVTR